MSAWVLLIAVAVLALLGVSAPQAAAAGVSPHKPSTSSSQAHTKKTTPATPNRPSGSQSTPRRPSTATPPSRPKSTINPNFTINRGPNKATPKVTAPGPKTATPGKNNKPTPTRPSTPTAPQTNPPATALGLGHDGSDFADDSDDDGLYEPHSDGDPDLPVMHIPTLHGGGVPLPGLEPPAVAPKPAAPKPVAPKPAEPVQPAPARTATPTEPAKPASPPPAARPNYAYPNAPRPPQVPSDYVAGPVRSGAGTVYRPPNSDGGDAGSIRIMNPTDRYPDGYLRVYNEKGEPIDINGRPSQPLPDSHFPIRPDGTYDFPTNWEHP